MGVSTWLVSTTKTLMASSVWFGIILVMFIELGQISPPIGINLFVIQSIWDGKLSEVVTGPIPFHLIMFVVLALVGVVLVHDRLCR